MSRARTYVAFLLGLVVLGYCFLPVSDTAVQFVYDGTAVIALGLAWAGVRHHRPRRARGWVLLLSGFSVWVVGDLLYSVETGLLHRETFPLWSDAIYLSGYVLLVGGTLAFVRTRRQTGDGVPLLDAAIFTLGVAVPAVAFIVIPASTDSSLSLLGRLTASAYPAGDLFLLAVLARLWSTPGASTVAFRLVGAVLGLTLVADCAYDVLVVANPEAVSPRWMDGLWLASYVLLALACGHPSMRMLSESPPDRDSVPTNRKLYLLAAGSVLPGLTLLLDGLTGEVQGWPAIGVGAVLLSALVLRRMAGLLHQVQVQAVQLAALARVDGLTGAPNRRTWDHELSRACATARSDATPLAVAILDLDHFKDYNDEHGHQAGDLLLREAVAGWTALLGPGQLLARYGGEEFAVLLPGCDLAQGRRVVERLRAATPAGQTFSAGVAMWDPAIEPGQAVAHADAALYRAKRGGRDRVETSADDTQVTLESQKAALRIVVQPIVDAATGRVVGHEALTRFEGPSDIREMFQQAHARGYGDLLEAHAVTVAMALDGRPDGQQLFVNVSGGAVGSDRFWDHLPTDLRGVVVELVEDDHATDWNQFAPQVARLRARGAQIAVDDLGAGAGDLSRLLAIRPDIIKIDRNVVDGCSGDAVRSRLVSMIVGMAGAGGAQVCAEGVEQAADLETLRGIGVHFAQGYLLGRPASEWADETTVGDQLTVR